jgi:hypothetical protein
MNRLVRTSVLKSLFVLVGAVSVCVLAGCGGRTVATAPNSPAPSPAPAWLVHEAATEAKRWGNPHPAAAYWGLVGSRELGQLTGAGPASSIKAYVIVLVGDYSKARELLSFPPGAQSSPLPPVKWLCLAYARDAKVKHGDVASCAVYETTFDVAPYPDLRPLRL